MSINDSPDAENKTGTSVFGYLRRWFLAGFLVTAPILLTGYLTWLIIGIIDGYVSNFLPENLNPQTYVDFPLPGFGLIIGGLTIIIIGALTTGFLGRSLLRFGERMLNGVPVIRSVYGATKQIMETVMASQSDAFREVVLIEYPRRGIWAIGFVTGTTRGEVQNMSKEQLVNVFVPTTPNPTSGFLLFFPREDLITLEMGVEEAVKMVVSGGIVTPSDPRADRKPKALSSMKTAAKTPARKKSGPRTKASPKS
ncbi:DUF502 domain-containing protein [Alphaproteobacteria bacterium LSUCC0684]